MSKWKFINNGNGWWLRIETVEQLIEYVEKTSGRFGNSMMNVMSACSNGKEQHYTNQLDSYLELLYRNSEKSLIDTAQSLMFKCAETYFDILSEEGFVNINKVGGCNGGLYPNSLVVYKDKLIFPDYQDKDLKIKTWEIEDKKSGNFRSGYKYHYYAYVGDVQIKDGDKVKWNTYEEAYDFAKRFIGQ